MLSIEKLSFCQKNCQNQFYDVLLLHMSKKKAKVCSNVVKQDWKLRLFNKLVLGQQTGNQICSFFRRRL